MDYATDVTRTATFLQRLVVSGLRAEDALLLAILAGDADPTEGEVSTARSVAELAGLAGISYDQANRGLGRLKVGGWIVRKQHVRRAGEIAITTLMPAALSLLGFSQAFGLKDDALAQIPAEISHDLVGQPMSVLTGVAEAWQGRAPLSADAEREFRGKGLESIRSLLTLASLAKTDAMAEAVEVAMELDELRAKGLDRVQTADGPCVINVAAFDEAAPAKVGWSFVRDVLDELYRRDPGLITFENLRDRIAEAGYARAALPFVKDKAYLDGVRLLAHQMRTRWEKPRRIWDAWYQVAQAVIHRPAVSA